MSVLEVNEENFNEEILLSEKPVVLDLFATWCGPCQIQGPIVEEIAKEHEEIKVAKVDVDKNAGIAEKYDVMSIPTIVIIKNGQAVKTFVGLTQKEEILEALK